MRKRLFSFIIIAIPVFLFAQDPGKGRTLVLEASKIEGKIKKPQVALISLEKRPLFTPIALTNLDTRKDIIKTIDKDVFESRLFLKPFEVSEKKQK